MRKFVLFLLLLLLIAGGIFFYYYSRPPHKNELTLYGNVDIRQVDLGFRVHGRVEAMLFEEGDEVQQGQLMGYLEKQPYLDQVREAQARVESIKVSLENADRVYKRRTDLSGSGAISQEDLENAQTSKDTFAANLNEALATLGTATTNLNDTVVYAPTDGYILTRIREPGSVVQESQPIYTLSIKNPVWIRAYVDEPNLGRIYPNMPAEVYTDTPEGKVYQGYIGFISPVSEFTPKTVETTKLRTDLVYRLRIYVENPDLGLRQGMPVTVKLYPEKE